MATQSTVPEGESSSGSSSPIADHEEARAAQSTVRAGKSFTPCELCRQPTLSKFGVCTREGRCREELRRRIVGVPTTWHVKVHRGDSVEIISGRLPEWLSKKQKRAEMAGISDNVSGVDY